jgi:hypothetical protein
MDKFTFTPGGEVKLLLMVSVPACRLVVAVFGSVILVQSMGAVDRVVVPARQRM